MGNFNAHAALLEGLVIPAHPLALNAGRKLDEARQRALSRYYIAAGAGGLAVGVHTTQFEIRQPQHGLLRPVLELAAEELRHAKRPLVAIGGICGQTAQALSEAQLLRELGYHAGLLSLAAWPQASEAELIAHCREVGEVLPLIGFYLQPAVGGRLLSQAFWEALCELPALQAIKIAAFNRYQTLDVLRAVARSGRRDIALYTGNDDNIIADLCTPFTLEGRELRFVGGLLGHWALWTQPAVQLLQRCKTEGPSAELLGLGAQVTDMNAAVFDAANGFAGCIAGIHEVLRLQGLLEGTWCLNPHEGLSPGQAAAIARVRAAYPHLQDDALAATFAQH